MMYINLRSFIIGTTCIYFTHSAWQRKKLPSFFGNKIPDRALYPELNSLIRRKIIAYHNYFRANVNPSAANMLRMKWHVIAARAAQKWANKCKLLKHDNEKGRFVERFGACGQNIFVSTQKVPWLFVIKSWYAEKDEFVYGSQSNDLLKVGHYTQMVWASSHRVGCGFSRCNGYFINVCNYCPPGNQPGKTSHPYRVGRPCSMCKRNCYRKRLCNNSCPAADLWSNCRNLHSRFSNWLCNTNTVDGNERRKNCLATCFCKGRVHD